MHARIKVSKAKAEVAGLHAKVTGVHAQAAEVATHLAEAELTVHGAEQEAAEAERTAEEAAAEVEAEVEAREEDAEGEGRRVQHTQAPGVSLDGRLGPGPGAAAGAKAAPAAAAAWRAAMHARIKVTKAKAEVAGLHAKVAKLHAQAAEVDTALAEAQLAMHAAAHEAADTAAVAADAEGKADVAATGDGLILLTGDDEDVGQSSQMVPLRVQERSETLKTRPGWRRGVAGGTAGTVGAGVLMLDLSGGRERVAIPVVNEVDDVTECVPPGFTYVCTSSVWWCRLKTPGTKRCKLNVVNCLQFCNNFATILQQFCYNFALQFNLRRYTSERISGAAMAVLDSWEHPPPGPGALAHTGEAYNEQLCLISTCDHGVVEPRPGRIDNDVEEEAPGRGRGMGTGRSKRLANLPNSGGGAAGVVGLGLRLPLEVFRCGGAKGWGLRCAVQIPVGAFGQAAHRSHAVHLASHFTSPLTTH